MRGTLRGAIAALLFVAGAARADGFTDPEAERLFKEGQVLLEQGQVHEACDKFDLSLRREHGLDTLALLALCHERDNKPGKAWNEFKRAEREAPPGEKAQFVGQHLKGLESKVARARLDVGHRVMGEVRVDNEVVFLDQGQVVTDPGPHTISVKIEGPGSPKVVSRNAQLIVGDNPTVVIELSSGAPPPLSGPETPPRPDDGSSSRRTVGVVLVSAGIVGIGVGAVIGLKVLKIKSEADDNCDAVGGKCVGDANAAEQRKQDAIFPASMSTVAIGLGAASVALGAYLIMTAGASSPAASTGSVRVSPAVGPGSLALRGTF